MPASVWYIVLKLCFKVRRLRRYNKTTYRVWSGSRRCIFVEAMVLTPFQGHETSVIVFARQLMIVKEKITTTFEILVLDKTTQESSREVEPALGRQCKSAYNFTRHEAHLLHITRQLHREMLAASRNALPCVDCSRELNSRATDQQLTKTAAPHPLYPVITIMSLKSLWKHTRVKCICLLYTQIRASPELRSSYANVFRVAWHRQM